MKHNLIFALILSTALLLACHDPNTTTDESAKSNSKSPVLLLSIPSDPGKPQTVIFTL